jgi:hypothetical protein
MVKKVVKKIKESNGLFRKVRENIGVIMILLALVAAIFALDNRYFKTAEAQQQEQKYAQAINQLNKNLQLQGLSQEEKRLYDKERVIKRDLARTPKDQTLADELQETQKDRDDVKKQINIMKAK